MFFALLGGGLLFLALLLYTTGDIQFQNAVSGCCQAGCQSHPPRRCRIPALPASV